MAYTFKSRSAASVTMLRANGDDLLRLIGKSPSARGVIPAEDLPSAIAALEAAIVPREPEPASAPAIVSNATDEDDDTAPVVPMRQRALPFLELLRQAKASDEPVTWGI